MAGGNLYQLGSERVHFRWRWDPEPILTVDPGDTVVIHCRDGFDGQANPPVTTADLESRLYATIDFRRVAPLTGPVAVRGAEPGDTLEVRILEIIPTGVGTVVIWPSWAEYDFLLREERSDFPRAWLRSFDMDRAVQDGRVELGPGLWIPLRPMMGIVGTAPPEGDFPTGPPRSFGGNMDVRDVATDNSVYLPVYRPGALFSTGDAHATQGDGEMCTTGIETPVSVTVQFQLHRGRTIPAPQIETPMEFMTVAHGRSLEQAARQAMRHMIDYLVGRKGLDPYDAYCLLSLAADLRINQVVNVPHPGVRVALPKHLFPDWRW